MKSKFVLIISILNSMVPVREPAKVREAFQDKARLDLENGPHISLGPGKGLKVYWPIVFLGDLPFV